jgi:hypothetical protein
MLECWNIGKMGCDIQPTEPMGQKVYRIVWSMAIIILRIKLKFDNTLQKTIVPPFHYSIIPYNSIWP